MFKSISKFIKNTLGQSFEIDGRTAVWQKVSQLKPGMKIAIPVSQQEGANIGWDEIVSVKKLASERVWDIEVEGTHNFVAGHYVNRKTGQALTARQEELYLAREQQRTTLADGSLADAHSNELTSTLSSGDTISTFANVVNRDVDLRGVEPLPSDMIRSTPHRSRPTPVTLSQLKAAGVNPNDVEYGGIVAHNTSGILMRAGASSLQLSSSATSTTADIELAAADQMDLFASKFSLTTSSSSNGQIVLSSAGGITLDTSRGTGVLTITGSVNAARLGEGTGTTLVADSNGNIIRNTSSLRYKHDVTDLDFDSSAIFNLDPKSFTWNSQGIRDFGLIAEEVAATLPQLALYDKEGRPEAVKYSQLSVLLLEETKKLSNKLQETSDKLTALQAADLKRTVLPGLASPTGGEGQSSWEEQIAEIDSKVFGMQSIYDTQQTTIQNLQTQIDDLSSRIGNPSTQMNANSESASNSATPSATPQEIESLKNRVSLLEELISMLTADLDPSQRTVLDQGQSSSDASASAVPDRGFTLETSVGSNVELTDDYKFYSETDGFAQILAPTTIGGSLTVGTLYFDDLDSSINSLGDTLRIQPTALADIEFLGGKIIMDKKGNLTVFGEIAAGKVAAGEYAVLGAGKTIGSGKILAGETSLIIENGKVNENSKIFTQFTASASEKTVLDQGLSLISGNPAALIVTKLPNQGFEVQISEPAETDVNFDYWIVQEE